MKLITKAALVLAIALATSTAFALNPQPLPPGGDDSIIVDGIIIVGG